MRKRFLTLLLFILLALPAFSTPIVETPGTAEDIQLIEGGVSFDWISKSQMQRDENIKEIQTILFGEKTVTKFDKKEFKKTYADFWKNKNYVQDYEDIAKGKKEDNNKYYCGFHVGKLLVAYGIQYKNDLKHIYYYDTLGGLRWIDVFSDTYPKFPYWSYQYYRNGEMVAAYYYVSEYDQYVFYPNKTFRGRWYNDKLYNRNAKVIMTRTNW